MAATVSKDVFVSEALATRYTGPDLLRLHGEATPEFKPLVAAELMRRPNIVKVIGDDRGASFVVSLRSPSSPFYGGGEDAKIATEINAQVRNDRVLQYQEIGTIPAAALAKGDRYGNEKDGRPIYGVTLNTSKVEQHVVLAKSVAVLAPELNPVMAEAARAQIGTVLAILKPDANGEDAAIIARLVREKHGAPDSVNVARYVGEPDSFPHPLLFKSRAADIEAGEQLAVRYAALPQLQTDRQLAATYYTLVTNTAKLGASFNLQPTEEFRNVVDNLDSLTTHTAPANAAEPPRSWKSDRAALLAALSQAREEVVGNKPQGVNGLSKAAQAEPFAAVVVDTLAKIADGNAQHGMRLTPRDGAVVKLAVGTAVQLLAATPEAPSLDKLAAVVGRYDAAQQQNFVNTLVAQKVPMPRVSTLIKGFTPGG